jgi:hypothetical protein
MAGKFFRHHCSFFFYNHSDFILRVSPLKNRRSSDKKDYFPPPGYGIPQSEEAQFNHPDALARDKVGEYGFYLSPGRLARDYFVVSLVLALCMFSPLINFQGATEIGGWGLAWYCWYGSAILGYLLLLGIIYRWIYYHNMSPVLTSIWPLWPEPSYHLLQSVPHKVHLTCHDKLIEDDDSKGSLYWNPKSQHLAPLFRQPQKYAKGTPTLQNVLLDFAVFEFFFFGKSRKQVYNNNKQTNDDGSKQDDERPKKQLVEYINQNETSWLYWLSPVVINYFMLVLMLPVTWILLNDMEIKCFLIEPKQALSFSIMVWAGLTYWFMKRRLLRKLTGLKDKVEQEYFSRYLELVPQQILQPMQGIPKAAVISSYILYLEQILSVAMFFAAVSYIGIIDGSF